MYVQNIGIDDRSQFQMLVDLPGGIQGLKDLVDQFHARGVRVGFPYNPCMSHAPFTPSH
jgi:iron(II)-dependent oxidoreductase